MTASALLDGLKSRGATVATNGKRLKLSAPPGVLTPLTLAELEQRKPEILELLQSREYSAPPILAEFPGLDLQAPGVWVWEKWLMPTRSTLPALRARQLSNSLLKRVPNSTQNNFNLQETNKP